MPTPEDTSLNKAIDLFEEFLRQAEVERPIKDSLASWTIIAARLTALAEDLKTKVERTANDPE